MDYDRLVKTLLLKEKANYKTKVAVLDETGKAVSSKEYSLEYYDDKGNLLTASDIVDSGTYVTVKVTGTGAKYYGTISGTYRVGTKAEIKSNLNSAKIKVASKEYTGKAIILKAEDFTTELQYGTDFTIASYSNNIKRGTAKVVLKAVEGSRYCGTKTVTFKIVAQSSSTWWSKIVKMLNFRQ